MLVGEIFIRSLVEKYENIICILMEVTGIQNHAKY